MVPTITPDSLAAMQVISRVKDAAGQFGTPDALTGQAAVQVLDGLVQQQAAIKAFNDVFLIIAGITMIALIPTLFLGKVKLQEVGDLAGATAAPETAD